MPKSEAVPAGWPFAFAREPFFGGIIGAAGAAAGGAILGGIIGAAGATAGGAILGGIIGAAGAAAGAAGIETLTP
eukprot:COSAG02_NODE_24190_length_695_cov_1.300336_1_plen_74_part_10